MENIPKVYNNVVNTRKEDKQFEISETAILKIVFSIEYIFVI